MGIPLVADFIEHSSREVYPWNQGLLGGTHISSYDVASRQVPTKSAFTAWHGVKTWF